jgi:putative ABC transport system permease protein
MAFLGEWLRRVRYLLNRSREEESLRAEMEAHRARMADHRRFGNTLKLREEARDVWGWAWLDDLVRDARFASRTLVRNPGFSIVSIASLALATGATTAIFSIVNGVLLRPLPLEDPDRLVQVHGRNMREDRGGGPDPLTGPVVVQELEAYDQYSRSFDGFTGYEVNTRHLAGPSGLERLMAVIADRAFFTVLGVEPIIGRTFNAADGLDVAVISARVWQQRFDGDPSLPGKTIILNGRAVTVLGVMPESFQFPYRAASLMPGALPESRTDVWVPVERGRGRMSVVARRKPGVSVEAAASELRLIAARIEEQYRGTRIRVGVRLEPLAEVVLGPVRQSLWMLFAAAGLVLAAACANVANLLLSRMTVRTREVLTRAALGADRSRLVRQFLAESLLLALAGGAAGFAVARWGTDVLVAVGSARIPRAHEIAVDWYAFGFLLLLCMGTAIVFGLAPALSASGVDVHTATKDSGGHATTAGTYGRIRDALVVMEVALAFVLALGAAVVMRELIRLQQIPNGMVTDNVLTLHVTPRASAQDYYAIEARVAQLPSVHAAGMTQLVPLQNWGWDADFAIRDRVVDGRSIAGLRYVTPGYFRALGIPLVRGRGFALSDTADAPPVVLINEALARRYFPGEDPVGRVLDRGTIVGVVGDVRQVRLDHPAEPEIYYPAAQNVAIASDIGMSLIVRAGVPPESMTDAIRSAVHEVNPGLATFNVRTLERVIADSLWELNLYRWLIGLFATLTLLIAAIGLYGVISYNVTSRMREFAVRLALGSDPAALAQLVLGRAIRLAVAGLAGGVLIALAVSPVISSNVMGADSGAGTYAAIGALLMAVALLACAIPAFRVAGVNPAAALRHE